MKWVHSLFCYTLNSSVPLVCFHFKLLTLGDRKTLSHIHSVCFLVFMVALQLVWSLCNLFNGLTLYLPHHITSSLPLSASSSFCLYYIYTHLTHPVFRFPFLPVLNHFPHPTISLFFSISVSHIKRKLDYWHLKRFYWVELSHQFPQLKFKWEENSRLHCRIFMGCKWAGKYIVTNDTSNCVQQHTVIILHSC